eukprot:391173_1
MTTSTAKSNLAKGDELMIFVRLGFVQFSGKVMAVMDGIWKDHYIIHVTPKQLQDASTGIEATIANENHAMKSSLMFNSDEEYIAESKQSSSHDLRQKQLLTETASGTVKSQPILTTFVAHPMIPHPLSIANPITNVANYTNHEGLIGSLLSLLKSDVIPGAAQPPIATVSVPKASPYMAISPQSTESASFTDSSRNSSLCSVSLTKNLMLPLKIPYPITMTQPSPLIPVPPLTPAKPQGARKRNLSALGLHTDRSRKKQKRPIFNPLNDKARAALDKLRQTASANDGHVYQLRVVMKQMDLGFVAANNVVKHYAKERGIGVEEFKRDWMTLDAQSEATFKCNVCYLEFKNQIKYEKHCKSHHNETTVNGNVFR